MNSLSKLTLLTSILTHIYQVPAKPISHAIHIARNDDESGIEVVDLAFSIKMAETALAIFSVTLVIMTYSVLIQRGSYMSTTAMYPQQSIERNLAQASRVELAKMPSIQLFYLGRMDTDNWNGLVAKGWLDCAANPSRKENTFYRPRVWVTSGSHLTKNVVQLLVWEWVSLWLIVIMVFVTLLYNGFLTNELSSDSYPRLVVTLIYALSYFCHFWYVWTICARYFTNVAAGEAWTILERAKFAICDSKRLRRHQRRGFLFNFRGIDKASSEHVPLSFDAVFKYEVDFLSHGRSVPTTCFYHPKADDLKQISTALVNLEKAQTTECETATESALTALDRVIANAMVMMGVTLTSGFSSWTARQLTDNTLNNFTAAQIGSLALLASLSLGVSTMFASAMHLTTLCSSYETILSLKEININGQAVDHYKKRQSSDTVLSFSRGTVPISHVSFCEILSMSNFRNSLGMSFLGPAFALMPSRADHDRTSKETAFDINVRVGSGIVEDFESSRILFTTRETDRHGRGKIRTNLEAIKVCYIEDSENGKSREKLGKSVVRVNGKRVAEEV